MKLARALWILLGALALALSLTPAGIAAAPVNDDIANATVITGLPYSDSTDTTEATQLLNEGGCGVSGHSVWYVWTPTADATITINAAAGFMPSLTLWYGGDPPAANAVCASPPGQLTHRVQAGNTYYLQVANLFSWESGGPIEIRIDEVPPPANDNFADAIAFASVPFSDTPDLVAATTESGEPMACGTNIGQSVWYAFTPATTGSYGGPDPGVSAINVYTGTSLGNLTSVACSQWWGLAFHAEAGTTYYLQVYGGGMRIDLLGPPTVEYFFSPGDPSTLDDVSFNRGGYWDASVTRSDWDFGDGTTASGDSVSHKFAADGDYDVTLTGTTDDGRSNSQTQTVHVRTHDVAIARFSTPNVGPVGQTRPVRIDVANRRYPETVQVQLFRDRGSGFDLVGTLVQDVPVHSGNRTTAFGFTYTFGAQDRAGVTFKAIASLVNARDAMPADNEAISQRKTVSEIIASSAGDAWSDSLGGSGRAVLTYGHIGCFDISASGFCTGGVWAMVPGGHWIWKTQLVSPDEAVNGTAVVTFRKQFRWTGAAGQAASLAISADDHYRVVLNGQLVGEGTLNLFQYDTHTLQPKRGVNQLEIEVQSFPGPSDPFSSPAGLAYAITAASP